MSSAKPVETITHPAPDNKKDKVNWDEIYKRIKGPEELYESEKVWRNLQPWLEAKGYMLRSRYKSGWIPSWGNNFDYFKTYEDSRQDSTRGNLLDATRISDGELVILKKIDKTIFPYEIDIGLFFSQESQASHPRNHCVPIYEILDVPDKDNDAIIVMPFLRRLNDPKMKTVGEALEFFRQIFEGLQFMHQQHVAHRDCMRPNIMMDPKPMFPYGFHPVDDRRTRDLKCRAKYYTRTERPTKYLFIDFGLSRKYDPKDCPPIDEEIIEGGDHSAPEFEDKDKLTCDPFPLDIYYLGNMIREDFLTGAHGVEFMEPLVTDMVQRDPLKRPTIDEVVERFGVLLAKLPWWKLRSWLFFTKYEEERTIEGRIAHYYRTAGHIIMRRNALPTL